MKFNYQKLKGKITEKYQTQSGMQQIKNQTKSTRKFNKGTKRILLKRS